MAKHIHKINGLPLAASQVMPGSPLELRIENIEEFTNLGAFEIVELDPNTHEPDVDTPSNKVIYLTRDESAQVDDPYTEWIWVPAKTEPEPVAAHWEVIGTTSIKLQRATTTREGITVLNSATVSSGAITEDETKAVTALGVKNAIGTLDAVVTSSDGTNIQVRVTEVDGVITGISIVTDNTVARPESGDFTAGHIPEFDQDGNIVDSGLSAQDSLQGIEDADGIAFTVTDNIATVPTAAAGAAIGQTGETQSGNLGLVTIATIDI